MNKHNFIKIIISVALFILLFDFLNSAESAISYVNDSSIGGSTASISCSLTSTTAGNGLIISLAIASNSDAQAGIDTPAMSGEIVNTAMAAHYDGNFYATQIFYMVKSLSSGGSKTFTGTITGATMGGWTCTIVEVSGQDATDFIDASNCTSGSNYTQGTTVTTVADNALLYGQDYANSEPTVGSGFTVISEVNGSKYIEGEYKNDAGAAGSKSVSMDNSTEFFFFCAASFKPAGGAPSTAVKHKNSIL